jgi:hypothetical protein
VRAQEPASTPPLSKACQIADLTVATDHPLPNVAAALRDHKALQDHLGDFQDAEVHRDAVRAHAAAVLDAGAAPAATLLAMGELVARYGERQRAAGVEAVDRVGELITDRNRRRVAGLVRAA